MKDPEQKKQLADMAQAWELLARARLSISRRRETSLQNQDSAFGDTISIAWHDFDKARAFGRGSSRRDDYRLEPFREKLATKTKTQKIGYSA